MELKEKLDIFKNKGFTYNPETGDVISHKGYIINNGKPKTKVTTAKTIVIKPKKTVFLVICSLFFLFKRERLNSAIIY